MILILSIFCVYFLYISVKSFIPMNSHAQCVTMFNGLNFSEKIEYHLGVQNLDQCLLEDKPLTPDDTSSVEKRQCIKF